MKKIILLAFSGFFLLLLIVIIALLGGEDEGDNRGGITGSVANIGLSDAVLAHQPTVQKYCQMFGITEYVPYLLAIMQVESGGTAVDVMQSSESLGLPPNSLGTEESIEQGCYYFSTLISSAATYGCDLNTVIQSYNYGGGFVFYVAERGKTYSFDLAMEFSREKSGGEKVNYANSISIPINGGWRYGYGNMFYVKLVAQYLTAANSDFIWPSTDSYYITSLFGDRAHPITGAVDNHSGIDIGASFGTNVLASTGGVVKTATYHSSYGNYVLIEHANGYQTLYAHMSQLKVHAGSSVVQGQTVGLVGSTGDSTGPHIHFEVWLNGGRVDPLDYFPETLYTIY